MFVKTYYISKFYYWNLFFSFKILKREKKVARKKFQKKKKRIEKYLIPDEIQIRKSPLLISASLGENIDALLLEWISLTPGIRLKKNLSLARGKYKYNIRRGGTSGIRSGSGKHKRLPDISPSTRGEGWRGGRRLTVNVGDLVS